MLASRKPGKDGEVQYNEGVLSGYRGYHAAGIAPAFAFGHGLGYAPFAWSELSVQTTATGVRVAVTVTNAGTRFGKEVVQFYHELPGEAQPVRRLAGFAKVEVAAGASATVEIVLDRNSVERPLSFWQDGWQEAHGALRVFVGASATDIRLSGTVQI